MTTQNIWEPPAGLQVRNIAQKLSRLHWNIQRALLFNSCYSWACGQIFFCIKMHTNKANASIQSKIEPFASFARQTANNCNNSYYTNFLKIENLSEVSTGTVDIGLKKQNLYFRVRLAREMKSMFLKLGINLLPSINTTLLNCSISNENHCSLK